MRFYKLFFRLSGLFLLFFLFLAGCTMRYYTTPPDDFAQEISHMATISAQSTDPSARADAHLRLALLSMHPKNPHPDYAKALQEFKIYRALEPEKSSSVSLQNRMALLTEIERLKEENKSLSREYKKAKDTVEALTHRNKEQRKTIEHLEKREHELKEMIGKLQDLDLQIEEKRKAAR